MSLYKAYLTERTTDRIIETDQGFVTYRYLEDGKSVYIIDIYVIPSCRQVGIAGYLADMVMREARDRECTEILGTVVPSTKNSNINLKGLLGYGMELKSSSNDLIILRKEIKWEDL
jgi:ribosomal protein S18 acetylase RimI-like enzyme